MCIVLDLVQELVFGQLCTWGVRYGTNIMSRDQSVGWHEYEKADVIDHANRIPSSLGSTLDEHEETGTK